VHSHKYQAAACSFVMSVRPSYQIDQHCKDICEILQPNEDAYKNLSQNSEYG